MATAVTVMSSAGTTAAHGFRSRMPRFSATIRPQSALPGATPKPRNARPDSDTKPVTNCSSTFATTVGATLGRTWRIAMDALAQPDHTRRLHVGKVALCEYSASHEAYIAGCGQHDDDDDRQCVTSTEYTDDHDGEQQRWNGVDQVDQAHDDAIDPTAGRTCQQAQRCADGIRRLWR